MNDGRPGFTDDVIFSTFRSGKKTHLVLLECLWQQDGVSRRLPNQLCVHSEEEEQQYLQAINFVSKAVPSGN